MTALELSRNHLWLNGQDLQTEDADAEDKVLEK